MSGRDVMQPLQAPLGLERDLTRISRSRLALHNELTKGPAWLQNLFADSSLPRASLRSAGPALEFRWRLLFVGRTGPLLQLALCDALLESLGLGASPRAGVLLALAECAAASMMPALRDFFEEDVALRVEEAPQGWPETDSWTKFQFCVPSPDPRVPAQEWCVPGRIVDPFALKLSRLLAAHRSRRPGDVGLPVFAGTRQEMPVTAALGLREGGVLLCEQSAADAARQIRLYVTSASARQEGRYLATLRRLDGRVEHLSPGPGLDGGFMGAGGRPRVGLDIVEARLLLSSRRCRTLALGQCLGEWPGVAWLDTPEVRLGGRQVASARRITVAGQAGFEIVALHRPG